MTHPLRSLRRPASVLAVLLLVPFFPPQHLHRAGIEGRTTAFVHAHVVHEEDGPAGFGGTALTSSHGDHRLAVFLSSDYLTESGAGVPADAAGRVAIVPPSASSGSAMVPASDGLRIHGPPRLASITRGPPPLS